MIEVRPFSMQDKRFRELAARPLDPGPDTETEARTAVRAIREGGEAALLECARRLDSPALTPGNLRVGEDELSRARDGVSEQFLTALSLARVNARKFHEYQRRRGYVHDDGDGVALSRRVRPLARVGVCCRDSFAVLLMCVVPAQVAGVGEIVVAAAPRPDGSLDPRILAAAKILGIGEIYRMDGAHAVSALAHGAGPIRRVDKIVGPGNAHASAAKRLLAGRIGVDAPSGRGELAVVADNGANAKFIAADFLAQAELEDGGGVLALFATDRLLAEAVRIELDRLAERLPDPERLRRALERSCGLFVCSGPGQAVQAANALAPARLQLLTRDNEECLSDVENAGAVFLGPWSPEAVCDYFAGANPILPIAGAARFAAGLGVDDFVREISVVEYSPERFLKTGRHLATLAGEEGKAAHAAAIAERLELLRLGLE